MVQYFEFIKQNVRRYISWNMLFFWGFGLWIALCTSNLYHIATLFSQQNWKSGIAYNITETETTINLVNLVNFESTNCTSFGTLLPIDTVLQYTYFFMTACLALGFPCIRDQITKSITSLNYIACNIDSKTIIRNQTNYIFKEKSIIRYSNPILQSKLIIHYEIVSTDLPKIFSHKELENFALRGHILQSRIIFNYCASFLLNSYKIYNHFNNQLFQNTWNLLTKHSEIENLNYMKKELPLCNNRKNNNLYIKKDLRKRIISSSPEFQKFIANLRSQIYYSYTLEMSARYIIHIKSI